MATAGVRYINPASASPVLQSQVWEALMLLDAADTKNPETCSDVVEIYSQRRVSKKLAGKPDGWNTVNSARGNKYYGDCTQKKSKRCYVPANREAALDTATDKAVWLPPSRVRGDIARSLMYMAVRYGSNDSSSKVTLQLSDAPNAANAKMGLLSVLLDWNTVDPPSVEEKLRNAQVCAVYQHNRNPFVDHPEYADLIWRDERFKVLKGFYKDLQKLVKDGMSVVVR